MNELLVEIVTPEALIFSEKAQHVIVPGSQGEIGVLPEHSPVISTLRPGVIRIDTASGKKELVVVGGFAEVTAERCTILADDAVELKDLSIEQLNTDIESLKVRHDAAYQDEELKDLSSQIEKKQAILDVLQLIK